MGREIRMVPPDWEHPKFTKDEVRYDWQRDAFHPLYDKDYDTACQKWYDGIKNFDPKKEGNSCKWYHEWEGNPPNEEYYRKRKWTKKEATHYQIYETVSAGTPVTPHFATKEELVDYLVEHGDFWDQNRVKNGSQQTAGWTRKNAESFVGTGFAMSGVFVDGKLYEPRTQGEIKKAGQ